MLKYNTTLEHKIEERLYKFICDHGAPIGEIYDSLCRMKAFVAQQIAIAEQAKEKAEACSAVSVPCSDNSKAEDIPANGN